MTNVHGEVCLPESARQRLTALRDAQVASDAVRIDLYEQHRTAIQRKAAAREELERQQRFMGDQPDLPEQAMLHRRIADAMAEIDRLNARLKAMPRPALAGNVERFVKSLRAPVAALVVTPKLGRGESAAEAVARLRAEQARIKADLHSVRSAPLPSAEAKAIVRAQVDELAAEGAPNVLGTLHAGQPFAFSGLATRGDAIVRNGFGTVPGTLAVLCWVARDALVERLEAEIDELADDSQALDTATRGYQLAELETRLLQSEHDEMAIIFDARQAGITIAARDDADIRAVLGLADEVTAA